MTKEDRVLRQVVGELRFRHPLPWVVNMELPGEVVAEVVAKDGTVLARGLLFSEATRLVLLGQELDRLDSELIDQIMEAAVKVVRR